MRIVFYQAIFLVTLIATFSCAQEDEGSEEAEIDEDDDPIVEDMTKLDLSTLEVVSREFRQNSECKELKEEVIIYRHDAKTASGGTVEVNIQSIQDHPEAITQQYLLTEHDNQKFDINIYPHLNCLKQDDPKLIQEVKKMIESPDPNVERNFKNLEANLYGDVGQSLEMDKLAFGGKVTGGFFVEAGSVDAETHSNTLHFEINHGWQGLLVEPNPYTYSEGKKRNRNATMINTCLSTKPHPVTVDFDLFAVKDFEDIPSMGGIVTEGWDGSTVKMQCMPLYTILLAIGNPTINYFSLDIEGAEFEVLKSIPWDKVDIQTFSIETHMVGIIFPGSREEVIEYMDSVGYKHIKHSGTNKGREDIGTIDDMFIRKDIKTKYIPQLRKPKKP